MTEEPGASRARRRFSDVELAAIGANLAELRRWASGEEILHWSLAIAFVLGLAAHVGGYLLRTRTAAEPLALFADLAYALGWALWTGVVVVLFVQVIPEAKRRDVKRALDEYEALPKTERRRVERLLEAYKAPWTEKDERAK